MCGIAGILYANREQPVDRGTLKRMADTIAHRGPDGEGFWTAPGIGLAHRRLSIIDLAGGSQPLGNEDGSVQVVFNGEIYNYRELRQMLERRGHRFRTASDTEVLVHLYEDEGEGLVERLRGMFAFALWDQHRRSLLLARDRLGIKPLYIYRDAEKLLFGSELKAILAHPAVDRHVSPEAIDDYLAYGTIFGSRSIFKRCEKLAPAHRVTVTAENLAAPPNRYWRLLFKSDEQSTEDEWREAIRAKVDETVRAHLIADVPVGAFLSGGLDSSVVVACGSAATQDRLATFSMGFNEAEFSELPYARQVARQFGTEHMEELVTPDAAAIVDELAFYYDEPFGDSSAVPTYLVSRLASRHAKVVLSGDGGDEAFGGYRRYAHDLWEASLRRGLPGWIRRCALAPLAAVWPKADWLPKPMRAKTLLTNLSLQPAAAYANTLMLCRQPRRRRLLEPGLAAALNGFSPEESICRPFAAAPPCDALAGMLAADVETLLPDDYLTKVDRASMACGLEVRPPLVDHELLELTARMPSDLKVRGGETKWLFKRAFDSVLPRDVVWRAKQGFEIPIDRWLRGPLRPMFEDVVLAPGARVADIINQREVERLYRAHLGRTGRHGSALWAMLMLASWSEKFLGPCQP